ncbi:hypothetical protein BD311DRAFT_318597 [Dichomitus squalens]|uniref:Uncharacterized protein n=1 Tax=Dichomitus squalens TaxID=114155 RepID=A0A4Q9MR05_9APHY|nr:hypothetical protein BD311DRAFT_318597 [Dichomitus squalens]
MRGIFLRRRFRRRLEEAIAAGVLLSPSDDGSGGFGRAYRRKLQRPTLFDVSVLPPYFSSSSPQDGSWEKIMVSPSQACSSSYMLQERMVTAKTSAYVLARANPQPFSGSVTSEKPETKDTLAETDIASSQNPPAGRQPRIRALFEGAAYVLPRNRLSRNRTGARPNPSPATPASSANASSGNDAEGVSGTPAIPLDQQDPVQRAAEVRVAVMVAMPNPHRSAYVPPSVDAELHQLSPGEKSKARGLDGWGEEGEEEAGVPDVVFGLAEVPLVQPSLAPAPAGKDQIS